MSWEQQLFNSYLPESDSRTTLTEIFKKDIDD
jgi:hypothetical protein